MTNIIRIEHLDKEYETAAGPVLALADVNVVIAESEFVAIMGPSGSGKSTFMNILGCLDSQSRGTYYLNGTDVRNLDKDELAHLRNRVIGFVFQGFNLLQRANLVDNVALPLVYAGVERREREQRAREMLAKVGLEKYALSRPNQISGGQQQRVAIARALVNRPRLIFADEPTGNLDTRTSHDIMELFVKLNSEDKITVILITHEADIARCAKRLVRFVDGRVVYDRLITDGLITDGLITESQVPL
jgi:putative ABC transport system ATP-binding protein